ncbi:type II CAAX endopeptidase family protein [Dokdonella immobilis]|uniref:CAAX protease self-immunity n=1 Tax=Dokdonella immobilis TaxID=578942 RepID=A0A1I5B5A5_9GAMM|nr:type II CAAX endopeptidase family protein [Dokdonella immobilis]SFN69790.1 CAAX protease self-immunity [Dokdonella immobilis]
MARIDRSGSLSTARKLAQATAILVTAVIAMLALAQLARVQLDRHLDDRAVAILGALVHAETPHRWSPRLPADIVAARAFGTDQAEFLSTGFRVRSSGQPVDIGLVIAGAIDLMRFSGFDVGLDAEQPGMLSFLVRTDLDGPLCISTGTAFDPGQSRIRIPLDRLGWTCGGKPAAMPKRAAMLRLRFELPPTAAATLREVEARPASPISVDALERLELPLLPSPREPHDFDRALARIAMNSRSESWPVLQLPFDGRVEQILVARDRITATLPDAVIVANGDFPRVASRARLWEPTPATDDSIVLRSTMLGVYALLLLVLRMRPPLDYRLRALLELLGVTAVPLGLIVGGFIGDDIDPLHLAACAITLLFALSLLFGGAPAQPSARTLKRGWWVALGSFALTLGVVLYMTHGKLPQQLPESSRVLHYAAWAAIQQFLICVIVAERIERVLGSASWGLLGAALVFSLLHTPNAMLMQLTFVAGLIWVWNWQRHRALLANMVAHAACGLLLTQSLPKEWLHSAEVSARFFLLGGS